MKTNTMSYKCKQFMMFAGVTTFIFIAVVIVPFIYGFYLTFTSWDGVSSQKPFVGIANYVASFSDVAYWQALGRTVIYSAIAVILVNVVAFILAFLVTSGVKGQNFFRAGFFIPNLIGASCSVTFGNSCSTVPSSLLARPFPSAPFPPPGWLPPTAPCSA